MRSANGIAAGKRLGFVAIAAALAAVAGCDEERKECGVVDCSCDCPDGSMHGGAGVLYCDESLSEAYGRCGRSCVGSCPADAGPDAQVLADAGSDAESDAGDDATGGLPTCSTLAVPALGACLTPAAGDWEDATDTLEAQVEGVVDAVTDGRRTGGCLGSHHYVIGTRGEDASNEYHVLLTDDDGATWAIEVNLPDAPRPGVGDRIRIDVSYHEEYFAPDAGTIRLADADGSLLWWIGEAGLLTALEPPEGLLWTTTRAACTDAFEDCGAWRGYDVAARLGDTILDLPYGSAGALGDLVILHGGLDVQTSTTVTCVDWFHQFARMAVMRAPASE